MCVKSSPHVSGAARSAERPRLRTGSVAASTASGWTARGRDVSFGKNGEINVGRNFKR